MTTITKEKIKFPFAFQWIIQEARAKEVVTPIGGYLKSETFNATNIPGLQYYLSIFPNESDIVGQDGTGIYLHLEFGEKIKFVESDYRIQIESANFLFEEKYIFDCASGSGKKCCTTEELFDAGKGFFVDGEMLVKVNGFLMVENEVTEKDVAKPWSCSNYGNSLGVRLWDQDNTKDITIEVGDKVIHAHKCILITVSPVFTKMFESGMKEAQENKIVIKDFIYEVVETSIKACYHQNLINGTTLEIQMKCLQFFDKYDIQLVKDDLESYLISKISESTVCQLANASIFSNAVKLEKECAKFLQTCLSSKKAVCDFDLLDKDFAFELLKNAFYQISL